MISPEVYEFPSPACSFQFEEGNLNESEKSITSVIEDHHFNHSVSIILPDTVLVPPGILNDSLSRDCSYYKILNVPVTELTQKLFIDAFVKKGQLTALSLDTKLDTDDCMCLTTSGHIVLSLNKMSYEKLGLEGVPSYFSMTKPASRYKVIIDLTAEHFKPGKKNYERVQWCFKNGYNLKLNILISWDPPDEKTCPSSVAAYFHKEGYTVQQCEPKLEQHRDMDILVPYLDDCTNEEMVEWLGACSLQADLSGTADSFISTYFTPVQDEERARCQIAYLQWTGFFTTRQIHKLFIKLREYAQSRSSLPWVAIHVQGFDDTPVCWGLEEHNYQQSGDNSYTFILQPDLKFLLCKVLGPRRKPYVKSRYYRKH